MKKIFTLIAAAFMAASVNAQGTFALQNGDPESAAGTQVTSVDNIIFTWGVAGEADFKGGNKKSEVPKARRTGNGNFLTVRGAQENNLKDLNGLSQLRTAEEVAAVRGKSVKEIVG